MVAGAGVALQAAESHLDKFTGKERTEAGNAQSEIKNIFDSIKAEMEKASQDGQQITQEKAEQSNSQINEYALYAETVGNLNQTIADEIGKAMKQIADVKKQADEKVQLRDQKMQELQSLGGEMPTQEDSDSGIVDYTAQDNSKPTDSKSHPAKNDRFIPKQITHNKTDGKQQRIAQLQQEIGALNSEISTIYAQIAEPQTFIAESTEEFISNQAEILEARQSIVDTQNEAQSDISGVKTDTNSKVAKGKQDLNKIGQEQTTAFTTNATNAAQTIPLKAAVIAEEAATKATDPYADTSAYEQAQTNLDNMNNELNAGNGAAKLNMDNANSVLTFQPQIQQASQQLMSGDMASYTNIINEVFTQALELVNSQLQIQLPTGESGEIENVDAGEVIADNAESSDKTPNDGDKPSKWGDALGEGMNSLLGNIGGGGDDDITGKAADFITSFF